jgi:hypothetical protein
MEVRRLAMKDAASKTDVEKAMMEISSLLFELRDAFVDLSLSLRDLQFETDLVQRKKAEETAKKLLQQAAADQSK